MKTKWDYSSLAESYLKRPDYARDAIQKIAETADVHRGDPVCDIGAGVAHLTLPLAELGLTVTAVEPNDNMRALGMERTRNIDSVSWFEGTGEESGQASDSFKLVTFGSSFNVTQRDLALIEVSRILIPGGWFACLWNHRNLDDPIQNRIEAAIKSNIQGYSYGSRREDQTSTIEGSGLYNDVLVFEGQVQHSQTKADCIAAWRSHATLHRQAGENFVKIVDEIEAILDQEPGDSIMVPYTTRVWMAQLKD